MILTGRKLEEIGLALYGRTWPTILAKRLRRSRRTIFNWRDDGPSGAPLLKDQLAALCDDQLATIAALRDELLQGAIE